MQRVRQNSRRGTVIPQIQMPLSWKQALEEAKELDVVLVPYENERGMEATREIFRSIPEGASIGNDRSGGRIFPGRDCAAG